MPIGRAEQRTALDDAGELVGINTFIMSRSGGAEGIGFAIPIEAAASLISLAAGSSVS